jgi:hypothetical protein
MYGYHLHLTTHGVPCSTLCWKAKYLCSLAFSISPSLQVLSAIEQKIPGFVTKTLKASKSVEDWGTDIRWLKDDELSYALGKRGMTRKKLARASGCIVEYVGNVVHMSGNKRQRVRANQYLDWLFHQLAGPVHVDNNARTDVSVVDVPTSCVGYVTGNRRETLGKMEEEWGVLMFFLDSYKVCATVPPPCDPTFIPSQIPEVLLGYRHAFISVV